MAKKYPAEYWEDHVKSFINSGVTQSEYCRQNKLDPSYFSKLRRNKIELKAVKQSQSDFIEIKNIENISSALILSLSNKYSIVIEKDFSRQNLNNLLDVLESRI